MKPDADHNSPTRPEAIELPAPPRRLPEIELPDDSAAPAGSRADSGTRNASEGTVQTYGFGDKWLPNEPPLETPTSESPLPKSPSGDLLKALHEVGFEIAACRATD